ncbi:DUF6361 family protein [Janthinobacterium aestuarii]
MSEFGWIDFSSNDKERVSQLLSMLAEPGTLDELGIGQIRDAFSDSLFAGFSTIQTRASYLIAIPQIFQDYFSLPDKTRARTSLVTYLQQAENDLAENLVANHHGQDAEELGIIGRSLVGKGGAARRPSSIYWNGLRQLGLVKTKSSLAEFCRQSQKRENTLLLESLHEEGNDASDSTRQRNIVCVGPNYGDGWMQRASIHLSRAEASFLREQIRHASSTRNCVPSQLVEHGLLSTALSSNFESFAQLSEWMKQESKVSAICKNALFLAQEFSQVMEGAQIRLDVLIAERIKNDGLATSCRQKYEAWHEQAFQLNGLRQDAPEDWFAFLPQNVRLRNLNKAFIRNWHQKLLKNSPVDELDELVKTQALDNKKDRSILKRTLDSHTYKPTNHALQYRWFQVQRILNDIQTGLSC